MLCNSGNEGCHVGDVGHHLIDDIIKVTAMAEVQRRIESHLVAVEYQLNLKQWCNTLGSVCIVHEVLQGAADRTEEACQDHVVHIVCVSPPLAAVQVCNTQQRLVLLW